MQYQHLAGSRFGKSSIIMVVTLIPWLWNCKEEEEATYPIEPNIENAKVKFIKGESEFSGDTLEITLIYTDGDGNVGLDHNNPEHRSPPFHEFTFFHRSTGEAITSDKLETDQVLYEDLISYDDRKYPPFDTLPSFSDCHYARGLYAVRNRNFSNLELLFLRKDNNGNWVQYEFEQECIFLNARIPTIGTRNIVFEVKPLSRGRVEVVSKFISSEWVRIFAGNILKLKLKIEDRNLNSSNYLLTDDFIIQ